MYYQRALEPRIKSSLFKGKVVILYGARQTGKTTLAKKILNAFSRLKTQYFNCDELDVRTVLNQVGTSHSLQEIVGRNQLVVLDEAQRVENIGLKLKLLADNFPKIQIIATGSSSFELSDKIIEPLTGRNRTFFLLPFSLAELNFSELLDQNRHLPSLLIYGSYPEVVLAPSLDEKRTALRHITTDYLYKDILRFQNLKNSGLVEKLLQALSLQVGSEVSYNELASLTGTSKETIASYLEILEKSFIIFRLSPFSRNLRKELGKLRKIYFWDNGIRNALIKSYNPVAIRDDLGKLWENFILAELLKKSRNLDLNSSFYFWRTYDQQEIDLVEERDERLLAYEIKWGKSRKRPPKAWRENYSNASWEVISRENYHHFLQS